MPAGAGMYLTNAVTELDELGVTLIDPKGGQVDFPTRINGRQAVFERRPRQRRYRATFIDQGFCFNAGEWTFPDSPLRGVYARNRVYLGVTGWQSFEPWLSRIEEMPPEKVWRIAELVPPEWYAGDAPALERPPWQAQY